MSTDDSSTAAGHPREAVAERNLAAILDSAERLMRHGQVPAISAVASESGVSRPTVYAHFPDRRRLVEAVVQRTVEQAMQAIASAAPDRGAPLDALHRLIAASWEQLSRHDRIGSAATSELSAEAMHRSHQAAVGTLLRLLDRGRVEGTFRTDLPQGLLVDAVLAVIHAVADAARTGALDPAAAGEAADRLVTDLWTGAR